MAKKKHTAKRHHTTKRHHYARRASGDLLGGTINAATKVKPAAELANFLLLLFGAVGSSYLTNKFAAKVPAKVKPLVPAAIGLGTSLIFRKYPRIVTPIKYGCYAVSGVAAAKTYLPQIPLLAGDVSDLDGGVAGSNMLGVDTAGRLVDLRDNSLLTDESGRTLNGEGEPHAENFQGGEDLYGSDMYGADDLEGDDLEGDDFL